MFLYVYFLCVFIIYTFLIWLLELLGKEEKPPRVAILLRGVRAGWKTILFLLFKIVFKLSPAAVDPHQADYSGTVEWKLPPDYGLKEGGATATKNTEQAPLLYAATVALPPLPFPGGMPIP